MTEQNPLLSDTAVKNLLDALFPDTAQDAESDTEPKTASSPEPDLDPDVIAKPLVTMAEALLVMRDYLVVGGFGDEVADQIVLLTYTQGMTGLG